IFDEAHARVLGAKLGLLSRRDDDSALTGDLFERMHANEVDFTLFFRRLSRCAIDAEHDDDAASLFANPGAFHDWAARWRRRLADEDVANDARSASMQRASPAVVPRNHRVEGMIAAAERDDFAPFAALTQALERPYEDIAEHAWLTTPPRIEERVQ